MISSDDSKICSRNLQEMALETTDSQHIASYWICKLHLCHCNLRFIRAASLESPNSRRTWLSFRQARVGGTAPTASHAAMHASFEKDSAKRIHTIFNSSCRISFTKYKQPNNPRRKVERFVVFSICLLCNSCCVGDTGLCVESQQTKSSHQLWIHPSGSTIKFD